MTDKYLEYIGAPCGTEDNGAKSSTSNYDDEKVAILPSYGYRLFCFTDGVEVFIDSKGVAEIRTKEEKLDLFKLIEDTRKDLGYSK